MTYTKTKVSAPTPEQFAAGAKVTLTRPGWENSGWVPHGFSYTIRFNDDGVATILKAHYDEWIGEKNARVNGVTVGDVAKKPPIEPQITVAESGVCPTCGASGDEPCMTPSGKKAAKRHAKRP